MKISQLIKKLAAEQRRIRLSQPPMTAAQARAQYLRAEGRMAEAHRVEYMESQRQLDLKEQKKHLDNSEVHPTI